jgi:oligopeptidase A
MHPFLSQDFEVRWSTLTPEAVEPDITLALESARAAIATIKAQDPSTATYSTTFETLESATEEVSRGWGRLQHLDSVCDNPAQRKALNAMLPAVTEFYSSIPLDSGLWEIIRHVGESAEIASLDPVRQRFVLDTLADFRESGADLPQEEKSRVAEIDAELSKVTKQYGENVLDSTNAWELVVTDEARLAGLPASAMDAAAANARTKGHEAPAWRFTLQFPSMYPVMQHAEDDSLRHEIWEASCRVGATGEHDNTALVHRILELRREKSEILGHANFADLTLQRRMARTGETALSFVEDLHRRIRPQFLADCQQLARFKAQETGQPEGLLEPWETAYWAERQRKKLHALDDEALRPYFPVDGVMAGMFEIATRLFGITIQERNTVFIPPGEPAPKGNTAIEVWHPECKFYEIHDAKTERHLGSFYADWHPRESKRGGAWMNSLHTGGPGEPHLGLIIGNMTPPVDGRPALLTHREVETIFHEFGHLLHGLLSEVPVKSLAGTNVAWDFVELPSQIMENFCWDRESLDHFARHHETGEPIPEDLFTRMIGARNYMSASVFMRQLALGKIDLELHVHPERWTGADLDETDRQILAEYTAPLATRTPSSLRRFNHIFSSPTGYAAGYYSYKWAEVLDADAFSRFQREGILNPETGLAFRQHILSQGNSAPPDELYRRFMGRDPELEPLLTRSGITAA